jgi:hypothetical protein
VFNRYARVRRENIARLGGVFEFEVEGESRSIQMRLQMQMCLKIQTTMRQDNTGDDDDRLGVEEKASATEW